jgi:hypothetical protein
MSDAFPREAQVAAECAMPPVPKRSRRMPGGQQKPDTELILSPTTVPQRSERRCGCSADTTRVIGFDEDRLEFASMTHDNTMMVCVHMPRSAFVAFRGVTERRVFVAPAASLHQWAAQCEAPVIGGQPHSFTLMYEQSSGLRDEVLTVTRSSVSPNCDDDGSAVDVRLVDGRTDCYQYEVVLDARTLASALATVVMLLGDRAFEMSVVSRDGQSRTTVSCVVEAAPAELAGKGGRKERATNAGAAVNGPASATTDTHSRITSLGRTPAPLRLFRSHCMPAGQLRDLAHMVEAHQARGSDSETVTLRLGVGSDEAPCRCLQSFR